MQGSRDYLLLSVGPCSVTGIGTDLRNRYPNLVVEMADEGSKAFFIVRQKGMSMASSAGPIYNPCLLVSSLVSSSDGGEPELEFQVFFQLICKEACIYP